jgi:hypothetical protein
MQVRDCGPAEVWVWVLDPRDPRLISQMATAL